MNDVIEVLKLVVSRLEPAGISYMVTGSLALSSFTEPRMTRDVDIVVALEPSDAERLAELLGDQFGCEIETVRTAIARQGLFNVIHQERIVKVDFIVRKKTPYRLAEFSRRTRIDVDGQSIWMTTPEDLLLSKLVWTKDTRSPIQLADAANLIRAGDLDWSYVERWAAELGVDRLLKELRDERHAS